MFTNLGSIECIFQQVALEHSKKEQNIFGLNIRKDMAEQSMARWNEGLSSNTQ